MTTLPERPQCSQQTKHAKNAEDAISAARSQRDEDVDQGDDHQKAVHDIPATSQVGMLADKHALRDDFEGHLKSENDCKNVV